MPRLFQFRDYTSHDNLKALSIQLHVNQMGGNAPYDESVRREAMRASGRLADVFDQLGQQTRVHRDLVTGTRLDPRKRRTVGVAMRRGEIDVNELRPYQRRESHLALPRIAIVASAGNEELHNDTSYVQRVSRLALALSWACDTIGVEVSATLNAGFARGALYRKQPYREVQIVYQLFESGVFTPLQAYSITNDRNAFLWTGFPHAYEQDADARERFGKLQNKKDLYWGSAYLSSNGGYAVHWARTIGNGEMVIAIGNIEDRDDADIQLASRFSVDSAVDSIIQQIREYFS